MPEAQQLLAELEHRYASISSYFDRGTILTGRRDTRPDEAIFRTWFVRPDSLRMDWRNYDRTYEPLRYIQWNYSACATENSSTYWCDSPDRLEHETEFILAFASAPSAQVAVANLLLPSLFGLFRFHELRDLSIAGTEGIAGRVCNVVRGQHPAGCEYWLWVSDGDRVLRRMRTDYKYSDEENDYYTGMTTYEFEEVSIDLPVNPAVFSTPGSLLDPD